MLLRFASAVVVFTLATPAFGITVLSIDDPSLQGTTIASESVQIDSISLQTGEPSAPVPVLFIDEKIVRNNASGLDFYFKLRNVGAPQTLIEFALSYPNSIQASAFLSR